MLDLLLAVTVAPSYGTSSGECSWPGPVRPKSVELSDEVRGMLKVGGQLPGRRIIALPFDEVLQAVVVEAAVEYGLDLPLLLAVDNDRWRWWGDLSWVGVVGSVLQERDVEDRVYLNCGW